MSSPSSPSPPKKMRKLEDEQEKPPDGLIRFPITDILNLDDSNRYSSEVEVLGFSWRASVKKEKTKGTDYLAVYLFCTTQNKSGLWSIPTRQHLVLVHPVSKAKNEVVQITTEPYDCNNDNWGDDLVEWKELTDEKKGFIKDGYVMVEIRFWILNTRGFRKTPQIDFTDAEDPCHDVALLIAGEKIYVSKQILAVHSPVFKATFFGNYSEKDKKEIELNELDPKEFIDMLHIIYPSDQKITEETASHILKLGDRFQIKQVCDKAEQFFLNESELEVGLKLLLSDQYCLIQLQDACLELLDTPQKIKEITESDQYKDLSDRTKATLLERMCKLMD